MVQAAREARIDGMNASDSLRALWESAIEHRHEQLVTYELTTYALRDPSTAQLAQWQYESYYQQATDYLAFVADQTGVEWTVPMRTLARLLVTVIDGSVPELAGRPGYPPGAATPLTRSPSSSPR
jgi:hypothetical protein